jgi:hypothetical protein
LQTPVWIKGKQEMKSFKALTAVCGLALVGALFAPAAKADDWNQKTVITFSGPVEIPGVHLKGWSILPAGTYVFKLLNSQSDRHIVQIFSADESTVYATILAIPNERLTATDKTVITFRERPAGEPEALRAWFYPGMTSGQEFVYPKAKAMQIAQETNTPVLSADIPAETAEPIQSATEPAAVALIQAPVETVDPTPAATPTPQAELPATASPVPMLALLGALALGGFFALRAFERNAS